MSDNYNNFFKLAGIYRGLAFAFLLTLSFLPFNELAQLYLPEKIAIEVAKIVPEIQTASAHTDDVFVFIEADRLLAAALVGGAGGPSEGGESGGGTPPGGGGASPVRFDWGWLLGSLTSWLIGR